MAELLRPNSEVVNGYIKKFTDESQKPDDIITHLIKTYPNHKNDWEVRLKAVVINNFYGTFISAINKLATHIYNMNIDNLLVNGSPEAVTKIATGHKIIRKDKEINFFSFATKYCNWHNHDAYPIYDSVSARLLQVYNKHADFHFTEHAITNEIVEFKASVDDFRNCFGLSNFSYKEIDKFLWTYGKEV
ncbi:MAG: hypothetical protein LBO69_00970 [Ignavibacteria bacterium]|nr:hypothetical protein [Ignavibacteria bacterium]